MGQRKLHLQNQISEEGKREFKLYSLLSAPPPPHFPFCSNYEGCKKRYMDSAPLAKCPIKETIKSEISPVSKSIDRLQSHSYDLQFILMCRLLHLTKLVRDSKIAGSICYW